MYYGRKKGIIIAIVIIVIILLLAIGGMVLYINTDLFKSNETLFLKYIDQTAKSLQYTPNTQLQNVLDEQEQMPYKLQGELNFEYNGEENTNTEILNQMQLTVSSNVNKSEEKSYTKATLLYQDQNLFNLEYANSNNIYALKSDEIVTAFVGIRNENLKVFAQKLGITDTAQIPDSIVAMDYNELLSISDEEKQHITDTYLPVIIENIPKENYTKQSNIPITKEGVEYNTTSYRLDLSSEEVSNIVVRILETLKQDSITLNLITIKAKLLNLSEDYTEINNLTQVIQKQIDNVNNAAKLPEEGISIIVYVEKGQTVVTEVIIKNEAKITIYGDSKDQSTNIYIMIENLSAKEDFTTLEIQIIDKKTDTQSNTEILFNKDNNMGIEVYIDNIGSAKDGIITSDYQVIYNEGENKYTVNYNQEITFGDIQEEIIELDNTNCAILNDYEADQLSMLLQLITIQTTNVLNQKIEQLGIQINQNDANIAINETDTNTIEQENIVS